MELSARDNSKGETVKPEKIAALAEAQGFRVTRGRHGWAIWPNDKSQPAQWISRNPGGRGDANNVACARKAGVIIK